MGRENFKIDCLNIHIALGKFTQSQESNRDNIFYMLFIWLTCLITVSPTIRHNCKKTVGYKSWLRFALSYKEGKTREQEQIILLFKKKSEK